MLAPRCLGSADSRVSVALTLCPHETFLTPVSHVACCSPLGPLQHLPHHNQPLQPLKPLSTMATPPKRMPSSSSMSRASSTHEMSLAIDVDVVDTSRVETNYAGLVDIQKPSAGMYLSQGLLSPLSSGATTHASTSSSSSHFIVHNQHMRECMAEFLGTLVMILFGMAVNNQVVLSKDKNGTWLSVNMCWGVAVMLGVHCSDGISGAHLNPAVTIAMATYLRLPWRKVPGYLLAQLLGAFVGAAAIYALYYQVIDVVDPDYTFTRANFATYPSADISNVTAFYTEFLATAMLLVGVFSITDKRNRPASPFGTPVHFMLLIWAIGMAFGMNTGYAINPARDFGPRLFTSLAGWGSQVFTLRNHYFWIPLVAPCVGAVAGGGLYKVLVEIHHPEPEEVGRV